MRDRGALPKLTVAQILDWADAFFRRHREWPHADSGPIDDAVGETWLAIDKALRQGRRGLPGNSSLAILLGLQGRIPRGARADADRGTNPGLGDAGMSAWAIGCPLVPTAFPAQSNSPGAMSTMRPCGSESVVCRAAPRWRGSWPSSAGCAASAALQAQRGNDPRMGR